MIGSWRSPRCVALRYRRCHQFVYRCNSPARYGQRLGPHREAGLYAPRHPRPANMSSTATGDRCRRGPGLRCRRAIHFRDDLDELGNRVLKHANFRQDQRV